MFFLSALSGPHVGQQHLDDRGVPTVDSITTYPISRVRDPHPLPAINAGVFRRLTRRDRLQAPWGPLPTQ